MVQGIGATFSPALAGAIDQATSYTTAMLALTAIALVALGLLVLTVPETRPAVDEPPEVSDARRTPNAVG
jgi:hypothetical protein